MTDLAGRIENGVHILALRVFYEDTDFSGYVYHANFLKFCERGRSDFLRVLGVDQAQMFGSDRKLAIVVRKMICDFLKPARFDDILRVETAPQLVAGARFDLTQQVLRGRDVLFAATVTAALIDGSGRPTRIPTEMMEKFRL
jgi:acyl-CoA thioester hydrolase